MTSKQRREWLATSALFGATILLAVGMGLSGKASWLESASFVTGAACVWLTVRENVWNYPIGLINVSTFGLVFLRAGLFADAGLQVVYLILGARGWYLWLRGGEDGTRLQVTRAGRGELTGLLVCVTLLTLGLWPLLRLAGGASTFWDALTTSISLGAQWLQNRKRLETWMGWILVDVIYVPLYAYRSLYLTSILYAVFLGMSIIGLMRWGERCKARRSVERLASVVSGEGPR